MVDVEISSACATCAKVIEAIIFCRNALGELVPSEGDTGSVDEEVLGSDGVDVEERKIRGAGTTVGASSNLSGLSIFEEVADKLGGCVSAEEEESSVEEEIIVVVVASAGEPDGVVVQSKGESGVDVTVELAWGASVRYAELEIVKAPDEPFCGTSATSDAASLCHFAAVFELGFETTATLEGDIVRCVPIKGTCMPTIA